MARRANGNYDLSICDEYRQRHMYFFHKLWDVDQDGVITRRDFDRLAEHFARIQRHGKLEKDVVERWQAYLGGWFDTLTKETHTDRITFSDWQRFCSQVAQQSRNYSELPDFIKQHAQLHFIQMDAILSTKKDGLIDTNDYRAFLEFSAMDTSRAKECFASMLNSSDMREHRSFLTRDRVDELVFEFWTDTWNKDCHGRYIMGPYDEVPLQELERRVAR